MINPKLYEVNSRVWIKRFGENANLSGIPDDFISDLASSGINILWLMGIWETCTDIINKYCFEVDLVSSYSRALKDWRDEDVLGSPYSINRYEINPLLGTRDDLLAFRERLNKSGIKLMLDFAANHFGADSILVESNPDIFLQADEELMERDNYTFFKPLKAPEKVFAHGRDPLFPPWKDTIQVNFFSESAREFLTGILLQLTELCDGVRCDMAMLPLNNVFYNTWVGVLNKFGIPKPQNEFWQSAIKKVKNKKKDFIFLAEAYWDLEWNLQQLGFDFTYDKRLTDRLAASDIQGVKLHLDAEMDYQFKSARFIENHDEDRAVTKFGKYRSLAAAAVISTIPGMRFYYDGQFEGKRIKLPVQLGREPVENPSKTVSNFYKKLLTATNNKIFTEGTWSKLEPYTAGGGNLSFENMFAWQWKLNNELCIVIINYAGNTSQCRIRFDIPHQNDEVILSDLLSGKRYKRKAKEISIPGLFIELKSYHTHIFLVE